MTDPRLELPELPSERTIDRLVSLVGPLSRVTQPTLYGVDRLPADGSLLVGNHTIYGFLDLPFMMDRDLEAPPTRHSRGFPPPPIVRGIGWAPIPRPERLYFWFGEPIETHHYGGRYDDTAAARALRDEVKRSILVGIQFLRDERDRDPNRSLLARLAPGLTKGQSTPWRNDLP